MAKRDPSPHRGAARRPRRDWGRALARLLCLLFALIGAVPLTGGLLLRSEPLQAWAARETSRILGQELGVEASFDVELSLIPLRLAVTDLVVAATDEGSPALQTRLAAISPRFFSLLAGRLDVGDIELEDVSARLVFRDGKLQNVAYRLPERQAETKSPALTRSPFRSLTVTNARVNLDWEGLRVVSDALDVDAFAEPDLTFDVALRLAGATFDRARVTRAGAVFHDEDRLCGLDLRAHLSKEQITVRRFSLLGAVDLDAAPDTRPRCDAPGPERLAVRLSQIKLQAPEGRLPIVRGRLMTRVPLAVVSRFVEAPSLTGWAGFSGEVAFDGTTRLPEVNGTLSGAGLSAADHTIAEKLSGSVVVSGDVVRVPELEAYWGNGRAVVHEFKLEPFVERMPLSVRHVESWGIDFPGIMREINITKNTIVDWRYDHVHIREVRGAISPFFLDGGVEAETSNFAVYDRAYHDPAKQRMIGVQRANVSGRWRASPRALEFYEILTTFGGSRLPVELVSIGLNGSESPLIVRLAEGATLDMKDVSPVAGLAVAGVTQLDVDLEGKMGHPALDGSIAVSGLSIGGFEAGDIERSEVHFEPLFVEFRDTRGSKGALQYHLPSAELRFDGQASVEFSAAVSSDRFQLEEFFRIFHFDEDPRFQDISGKGRTRAAVRYVMGGPEDTCDSGRLTVEGKADFDEVSVFGESFGGGTSEFSFEWFDMEAGARGMRVEVPSLSLQKGSGSLFGSVRVDAGGQIRGHVLGTRVPLARVDAFSSYLGSADGFVTGLGRVEGTLERLRVRSEIDVTDVRFGEASLPPSHLWVEIVPPETTPPRSGRLTACGRDIPVPFKKEDLERDESDGDFLVNGELFGGQIRLRDVAISRQKNRTLRGKLDLESLDLASLLAFGSGFHLPVGRVSGSAELEEVFLNRPFESRASATLSAIQVGAEGYEARLEGGSAQVSLGAGALSLERFSLALTTPDGQTGVLDAEGRWLESGELRGSLHLRETSLGILGKSVPGVERAEGRLSLGVDLDGTLTSPALTGFVQVKDGRIFPRGLSSPLSELELRLDVDKSGLRITRGSARWGGGAVRVSGGAPLSGGRLGTTRVALALEGITLPLEDNVRVSFDAGLDLEVPPPGGGDRALPRLTGDVTLASASYERPMSMTADLSSLTGRGKKSDVDAYIPENDHIEIDVVVRSKRALTVKNDLVETSLALDPGGLHISGTNQRFGAVGNVEIAPGGRIFLRRNAFEVKGGLVRFNDPTRLRPEVDVTASTELRRYEDRGATQAGISSSVASGTPVAGNWRILLRAYGPPEDLRVDLTSDPPLGQDDIFLLLTIGLTRAELDQTRSSGVGQSMALEALGSLSGAESAVTDTVPIDEFRFGSTYSARSGRTEPTVTIGKRLSERLRASVTTSLSETNEVRSNLEYRATKRLSFEGSYDNAQRAGAPALGNLGGDIRWRIEFE